MICSHEEFELHTAFVVEVGRSIYMRSLWKTLWRLSGRRTSEVRLSTRGEKDSETKIWSASFTVHLSVFQFFDSCEITVNSSSSTFKHCFFFSYHLCWWYWDLRFLRDVIYNKTSLKKPFSLISAPKQRWLLTRRVWSNDLGLKDEIAAVVSLEFYPLGDGAVLLFMENEHRRCTRVSTNAATRARINQMRIN